MGEIKTFPGVRVTQPKRNAVIVELVNGGPFVSIECADHSARELLERIARDVAQTLGIDAP